MRWIINTKTNKYVATDTETFDGDWVKRYPHLKDDGFIFAANMYDHDMVNGIYYVYDLCRDGMMATLIVDMDKHTNEDIKKAKKDLRYDHDVVSLKVMRLKEIKNEN